MKRRTSSKQTLSAARSLRRAALLSSSPSFPGSYRNTSPQAFSKAIQTSSQGQSSPKPLPHNRTTSAECPRCISKCPVGIALFPAPLSRLVLPSPSVQMRKLKHRGKLAHGPEGIRQGFARGHLPGFVAPRTPPSSTAPGWAAAASPKPNFMRSKPGVLILGPRQQPGLDTETVEESPGSELAWPEGV